MHTYAHHRYYSVMALGWFGTRVCPARDQSTMNTIKEKTKQNKANASMQHYETKLVNTSV